MNYVLAGTWYQWTSGAGDYLQSYLWEMLKSFLLDEWGPQALTQVIEFYGRIISTLLGWIPEVGPYVDTFVSWLNADTGWIPKAMGIALFFLDAFVDTSILCKLLAAAMTMYPVGLAVRLLIWFKGLFWSSSR